MSGSWRLGRVAGIPIYVHWTFLILLAWVFFGHVMAGQDLATAGRGVAFVLALFGCVVLHELGHALAARRYGVPTADITLLPIGGLARLREIPDKPVQELVIALAGPAVNLAIAIALILAGVGLPRHTGDPQLLIKANFLPKLLAVNLFLMLFNLLPAFPMDGGRVLRAMLALVFDYGRATRAAARIGRVMAIFFGFLGLTVGNPTLLLIAVFVWFGAEAEAAQVQEKHFLWDACVRDAMLTDFRTLSPAETLGDASALLLAGSQRDFPVIDDDRVVGLLSHDALISGLVQLGAGARLGDLELAEVPSVEADAPLLPTLTRLREAGTPRALVRERGALSGLLTTEHVGEYVLVRMAQSAGPHPEDSGLRRSPLAV